MQIISYSVKPLQLMIIIMAIIQCLTVTHPVLAGPYLDSAHGNSTYGVNRASIDAKYNNYAVGNCAHCHELHASLDGGDPLPVTGAQKHMLFAPGFNQARELNPYVETDNFCFYCHGDATGPMVTNQDYSAVFGGATIGTGPQSIIEAFNQDSYHNLYDISAFLNSSPIYSAWFAKRGNPCSACHNSHLAKRNWESGLVGYPLLSAISLPGSTDALWGETEVMSVFSSYEAPYAFDVTSREPGGVGDIDGTDTPDYVSFCISCHNPTNTVWSTTLNREIWKIDWGTSPSVYREKHGPEQRDGSEHFREPYAGGSIMKTNFVLSCMDCHEAHGSANVMLLRRRINGEDLEGNVLSTDTLSYVCKRCHNDDAAASQVLGSTVGTGQSDRWEYVHHGTPDAPYAQQMCGTCHVGGGNDTPIACGSCHGHGKNDNWLGANASGRKTF